MSAEGNHLPRRKANRLEQYDYSQAGCYFVTLCTRDRQHILSRIAVGTAQPSATKERYGWGVPLAGTPVPGCPPQAQVILLHHGQIADKHIRQMSEFYEHLSVDRYVIMPDHIHAVIFLHGNAGGASPSPTLDDVICAFKSLTSRSCKQKYGIEKMFQRSSAEHIVRDREDYETRRKYIYENPERWYYKYLNAKE